MVASWASGDRNERLPLPDRANTVVQPRSGRLGHAYQSSFDRSLWSGASMDQSRAGPSSRVFLAVTLPGFAALLAAALIVIERAAVDPTVSAGVERSSSVPA